MSKLQSVKFIFSKINTDEFAILGESLDKTGKADVKVDVGFNFLKEQRTVGVKVKCTFHQQSKLFVVIAVSCFFTIDPTDWMQVYSPEKKSFFFPKDAAHHLVGLTIGVLRGVLHTKTEKHPFNTMVLPPIFVQSLIKDDVHAAEVELSTI